jgi:hypothetical protein
MHSPFYETCIKDTAPQHHTMNAGIKFSIAAIFLVAMHLSGYPGVALCVSMIAAGFFYFQMRHYEELYKQADTKVEDLQQRRADDLNSWRRGLGFDKLNEGVIM